MNMKRRQFLLVAAMAVCSLAWGDDVVEKIRDWEIRTGELPRDPNEKVVEAPHGMKLVLLVGQSNMAGRAKVSEADRPPLARALKLNRDDQWAEATAPLHFDRKTAGIGPANEFVKRYLADHPGETVGIVPCAVGGSQSITWDPHGKGAAGANFRRALARAKVARRNGTFVAILWHQGESDSAHTLEELRAYYPQRFGEMIAAFRAEIGDVPVVVGEVGRFFKGENAARINTVLNELPKTVAYCACVSSEGLADGGDKVHFGVEGANALGARYYDAYAKLAAAGAAEWPFSILRNYGAYEKNRAFLERVFAAQERRPGLFGEIWFSAGCDTFEKVENVGAEVAKSNLGGRDRCRALGIRYSYQQGVTLNHDPDDRKHEGFPDDAWVVDWTGRRRQGLFCPSSPFARDYAREKTKAILTALRPDSFWPDDDLRMTKLSWKHPAQCFCERCLGLFGERTGRTWTREALFKALEGNAASAEVRRQWCAFNGEMLGGFAKSYREAVDAVAPETRLGIQGAFTVSEVEGDGWCRVMKALAGKAGAVGMRPGYGYYDDQQPRKLLEKMVHVAREAGRCARLPETRQICFESENWPHVGAHKNAHGQMAECALALASGCDSIAFYWGADQNGEDAASYDFWLDAVGAWRPFHLAVRDAFAGTRLGGVAAYFGSGRYGTADWINQFEHDLVRLAGNGLPVTVPEAEPDVWLVNDVAVRTMSAADLPKVFSKAVMMEPAKLTALAKKFPTLRFTQKVSVGKPPEERALSTATRSGGYERFKSGRCSDRLKAFVYPQAADVVTFSEMTKDPKACGTCVVPTEFGGKVVLVQDADCTFPHVAWPGSRRHGILDALDAAVPGGMPARLLTDGYATSVSVRKTAEGNTAGVFILNLGMGETPPLELAIRRGVAASWRVARPRLRDELAEVVRESPDETVLRLPPLPAFGVALVAPAR